MSRRLRKLHGWFLILSVLATPALATTVQKMELPQMVSTADSIVQGRVEAIEGRAENGMVYTYVSVVVDDPIKGDRRRTVLVRQLGGTAGGKTIWVSGMPQFKRGDEVIVFLRNRKDGTFDIVGLNQGKYEILNNYAVANVSGVSVVDPKTGRMTEAGFVEKAPVETFKAKIRELMR